MPPENTPQHGPENPLNPAAVGQEQLARLLGIPMDVLCRHVAEGAPTNANGTINLIHYAAWLNANPGQPVASGVDA